MFTNASLVRRRRHAFNQEPTKDKTGKRDSGLSDEISDGWAVAFRLGIVYAVFCLEGVSHPCPSNVVPEP